VLTRLPSRRLTAAVLIGAALTVAACGGDDGSGSGTTASSGSSGGAQVSVAKDELNKYVGKPTAFPVDKPLAQKPGDFRLAYLQCVTPICGLFGQIFVPAAKAIGATPMVVKAGGSADQLQAAMETIISKKPSGVVIPAVEPDTINNQLAKLKSMGIPVVSNGIMNHEKYGIGAAMFNTATAQLAGKVLADYATAHTNGKADVAFALTPELSFGRYIKDAFDSRLKEVCPSCKVRDVTVPVTTIGSSAPSRVVSDLQAHPDTNLVVFSTLEAATGLPAAMRAAGLKTTITGFGPNPQNLQDLKAGGITSAIGMDIPAVMWTQVDAVTRLATKQSLTAGEAAGIPPLQWLEQKDITFDAAKGWTGYPDFPQRFAKLWAGAKTS
jgi:ribose transport system substrate-binding protein